MIYTKKLFNMANASVEHEQPSFAVLFYITHSYIRRPNYIIYVVDIIHPNSTSQLFVHNVLPSGRFNHKAMPKVIVQ